MSFVKLSMQGLNALFANLTEATHRVIWVRTPDFERQLYLSQSYETVWQRSCNTLYEAPHRWGEALIGENRQQFVQLLKSRKLGEIEKPSTNNAILYRIHTPCNNATSWIKDSHFYLYNELNEQVAIAGIAEAISQIQWELEAEKCCSLESKQTEIVRDDFIKTIEKDLNLVATPSSHAVLLNKNTTKYHHIVVSDGRRIKLSKAEIICLSQLLQGKSAQQISETLCRSRRTIETHLAHIKDKVGCHSVLELITHLKGFAV